MPDLLILLAATPVIGLIIYYISIRVINNRKTENEMGFTPNLSLHCHVKSDSMVGFSSGKSFYSAVPARFTIYPDFVLIKAISDRTYPRNKVVFVERQGFFRQRLFIRLKELGNAIEILGKTSEMISALRLAGYEVLMES